MGVDEGGDGCAGEVWVLGVVLAVVGVVEQGGEGWGRLKGLESEGLMGREGQVPLSSPLAAASFQASVSGMKTILLLP